MLATIARVAAEEGSSTRENFAYLDVEPWHWVPLGFITVLGVIVGLLGARRRDLGQGGRHRVGGVDLDRLAFTGVIYALAVSGDGHARRPASTCRAS